MSCDGGREAGVARHRAAPESAARSYPARRPLKGPIVPFPDGRRSIWRKHGRPPECGNISRPAIREIPVCALDRASRAALAWAIVLGVSGLLPSRGWRPCAARPAARLPAGGRESWASASTRSARAMPADRGGLRAGDEILRASTAGASPVARSTRRRRGGSSAGGPCALVAPRGTGSSVSRPSPAPRPAGGCSSVNCLTALGFLAVALLALAQGPTTCGCGLLFGFSAAAALEIALPVAVIGRPALSAAALSAYYLLTGLQIGLELHLASLIPERPGWLRRRPWIVPLYYVRRPRAREPRAASPTLTEQALGRRVFPWTLDAGRQAAAASASSRSGRWPSPCCWPSRPCAARSPGGASRPGWCWPATIPWMLFMVASTALELGRAVRCRPGPGRSRRWSCSATRWRSSPRSSATTSSTSSSWCGGASIYTTLTGALVLVFYAALGAGGVRLLLPVRRAGLGLGGLRRDAAPRPALRAAAPLASSG